MKIRDRKIKETVDLLDKDCLNRKCYWPRLDPGFFIPGQGYRQRSCKVGWLCGTREVKGCPKNMSNGSAKGIKDNSIEETKID